MFLILAKPLQKLFNSSSTALQHLSTSLNNLQQLTTTYNNLQQLDLCSLQH
uniref:Uncharacterized protein n=1 Tax=Rhizophagus irregularis (strain DAOM 181602 / DAOM 197198 / MUCL 43194) TaxID=747089 RepID=U9TF80_RHIID